MHPYRDFPKRQFWAKAVAQGYDASAVGDLPKSMIAPEDKVVTAGSCFAANLIPYLQKAGLEYLRTEYTGQLFKQIPQEALAYGKFSAGYGNIYTARQLLQLLQRAMGQFKPVEDRWAAGERIIDPFRPALTYSARCEREFDALTKSHFRAVLRAFSECNVLIFTLGLTEAWASKLDGAVYPACPGTIAGEFDPARHEFVNFTLEEVVSDLEQFLSLFRQVNPAARLILTVSPVPLVATAESRHVLASTVYSKSVLRVAAEVITRRFPNVFYFPAYEIVTGPQAPENFFEADRRSVSSAAVNTVMTAFLSACGVESSAQVTTAPTAAASATFLSAAIADLECEEAAQAT